MPKPDKKADKKTKIPAPVTKNAKPSTKQNTKQNTKQGATKQGAKQNAKPRKATPDEIASLIATQRWLKFSSSHGWLTFDEKKNLWVSRTGKDADIYFRSQVYKILKANNNMSMNTYREVTHMVKGLVFVSDDEINSNPNLINLENGYFNIATGRFTPHPLRKRKACGFLESDPYISTIQLPFQFDREARCDRFIQFVNEVVEPDTVRVIQELLGLLLIGNRYQKIFFFLGPGRNGKGILSKVCQWLVGKDNYSNVSIDEIGGKFVRVRLHNKLLNVSGEIAAGKLRTAHWLKALSGGDEIEAEKKYGQSFNFRVHANLLFAMNELADMDYDRALYERIELILFPNTFWKNTDYGLEETLYSELSGIFNWAIIGLRHLLKRGHFKPSESMLRDKERYLIQTNPLWIFCRVALEKNPDSEVILEVVRNSLRRFQQEELGLPKSNWVKDRQLVVKIRQILTRPEWDIRSREMKGRTYISGIEIKDEYL